jgi:hypothetical protein
MPSARNSAAEQVIRSVCLCLTTRPTLAPTPVVHTFVVALQGGGEMRVLAVDEAAGRNNVKSSGATPAD